MQEVETHFVTPDEKPDASIYGNVYEGCIEKDINKVPKLVVNDGDKYVVNLPIRFDCRKPNDEKGEVRDQTGEAAEHMRYAGSLGLPELRIADRPRMGRAIIVGGGPSIESELENIKRLAADPDNWVFAVNSTHTWLIEHGVAPTACVFFEIDAEPDKVLESAHSDTTYYICSHCHNKTFDSLKGHKRVLWHSIPNSPGEEEVAKELFPTSDKVAGGIGTFTRSLTVALFLGFRQLELFGCDSSFPDDAPSTHVEGYETENKVDKDAFYVYARHEESGLVRRFKTVGYLALQVEEFKYYCQLNHQSFACRVHGSSLLRFVHQLSYPDQYAEAC